MFRRQTARPEERRRVSRCNRPTGDRKGHSYGSAGNRPTGDRKGRSYGSRGHASEASAGR